MTHHVVRNLRMYLINRNKNNANLFQSHTSTLKKQSTKQFKNTLDMHGWHVFLYDLLN